MAGSVLAILVGRTSSDDDFDIILVSASMFLDRTTNIVSNRKRQHVYIVNIDLYRSLVGSRRSSSGAVVTKTSTLLSKSE